MNKTDTASGMALVALLAVCCGGHLLLLLGLPLAAALAGQAVLIAAATAVALAVLGVFLWRRRARECRPDAWPLDSASRIPGAGKTGSPNGAVERSTPLAASPEEHWT